MSVATSIRTWARRVKRDGVTLWFALRHPATPIAVKALAAVVVSYALSPIDLIPDFVPILGYLDDVLLLPALIWLAVRMLPAPVYLECQRSAEEWMASSRAKPRSAWGAVLVVVAWALVAWVLVRWWTSQ